MFCISSFSQNSTDQFLKELKLKKIDTICTFIDYSVGSIQIFNKNEEDKYCELDYDNLPTFILWKENGKTFLTKTDNCFKYSTLEINAEKIWQCYFENEKIIKTEKVKSFQFVEIKNGKKRILNSMVDHSHHQKFKIIAKNEIIEKHFDDFDLKKTAQNGNEININYKNNIYLKSKKLIDKISNIVLENENSLTKKRIQK